MNGAGAWAGGTAGVALGALGLALLRAAWRGRRPLGFTAAGWVALAAAAPAFALTEGWDKAVALAVLAPCVLVLPLLAAGAKVRRGRTRRTPRAEVELPEPDRNSGAPVRTWVRTLLCGPLAGAAALSLAAAFAARGPADAAGRAVFAFLLAPILWALGLVWATTDANLKRAGAGLFAVLVAGVALVRL